MESAQADNNSTLGRVKERILQWESGDTHSLHRADVKKRTFRKSLYSDSSLRRPTTRDPRQKQALLPPYRETPQGGASPTLPTHAEEERRGRGDFQGRRLRLASTGSVLRSSNALNAALDQLEGLEHESEFGFHHASPLRIITDLDDIWKASQGQDQGYTQGHDPHYLRGQGQGYHRSPKQSYLQSQGSSPNVRQVQNYFQSHDDEDCLSQDHQDYLQGQSGSYYPNQGHHFQGQDDGYLGQGYCSGQGQGLPESWVVKVDSLLGDIKTCLEMIGDRDLKEQVKDVVSRDALHFLKDWLFSQEDLLTHSPKPNP
ncbi:hypothetical protein ACOMHN_017039 [Nucella lapillus]